MKAIRHHAVLLFTLFAMLLSAAQATAQVPQSEAQLVRLSYVEGDVRFNRGDGKRPDLKKPWEQAEVNLPIGQGFALATGTGRAEVEFETGEMIYVADNSVVLFEQLTITGGVPATRMELVTGTVTTSVAPLPKELFAIAISNTQFKVTYPETSLDRIDSYLDGMAITPQGNKGSDISQSAGSKLHLEKGQTIVFNGGRPVRIDGARPTSGPNDWDQWVSTRYTARVAAMTAALKTSGLSAPIPGLTDLYASGTFSPCAPYGTCWDPSPESLSPPKASQSPSGAGQTPGQALGQAGAKPFKPQTVAFRSLVSQCPAPLWVTDTTVVAKTPQEFDQLSQEAYMWLLRQPFFWPTCHYSSWIYRDNRYHLVIRRKRRHHPVHWVKVGKQTGFVPAHPSDKSGQPPKNLKHGIFVVPAGGKDDHIERVDFNSKEKVEILSSPPKEFRPGPYPQLASAEPPEIHAHLIEETAPDAKSAAVKGNESRITYDYGKGKFVQSGVEFAGRATKPVVVGGLSSRGGFSPASGNGSSGSGGRSNEASSRGGGGSSGGGSSAGRTSSGGSSGGGDGGGRSFGGGGGGGGSSGGGGGGGSRTK